jgi:biopolymer transport protein ExbD
VALVVTLDAEQQLHVNKQHVVAEDLRIAVIAELSRLNQREVILRADRHLPYEVVLKTLVELRQAGAEEIHLAYENQ